jgi:hypothetical protein
MPLVTLTVRKPKTPAFKAARLDGAHAAVAAGVPAADRFQRAPELETGRQVRGDGLCAEGCVKQTKQNKWLVGEVLRTEVPTTPGTQSRLRGSKGISTVNAGTRFERCKRSVRPGSADDSKRSIAMEGNMKFRVSLLSAMIAAGMGLAASASAEPFFFTSGNPDGRLGALARSESSGKIETETADDFILAGTTVISGATITGLVVNAPAANISNVEVELYHVFPLDSIDPPSGRVLSRVNSPSDVEIDAATRDGSDGTLGFVASRLATGVTVANTVANGINPNPSRTKGEGAVIGDQAQITITFKQPIVLPAGHYFFRPDVLVNGGDFFYMSAPRSPGVPFTGDLQAWIRNTNLAPDWVRIGTDVIGSDTPPAPTFNMTFSLAGNTVPQAGTPGEPNCHGQSISALARQFGGIDAAASALGFSGVDTLQSSLQAFCSA